MCDVLGRGVRVSAELRQKSLAHSSQVLVKPGAFL